MTNESTAKILHPSHITSRDELRDMFHVSSILIPALDKYYILHWESKYLFDTMLNGTLMHDGIVYQVSYHPKYGPASLKQFSHVKISFRKLGNIAYAVIRPIHEDERISK